LSSLYDKYDDLEDDVNYYASVSKQHISNRAKKLAEILEVEQEYCEEILSLYTKAGFILNKSNRLAYPSASTAQVEKGFIARGIHPSVAFLVSGIGFFVKEETARYADVDDMFNLVADDIMKWHELFIKSMRGNWNADANLTNFEFINTNVKPWKSYWTDIPPKNGLSLCRSKDKAYRIYRLISVKQDNINSALLPYWSMKNGEYLRLAISLRIIANNPPRVRAKKYGKTAIFDYDYLLPPSEQNFIEVYSWKHDNSQSADRWPKSRIVAIEMYQLFIKIFRRMGYLVEED
jgi:hypothetical protein